MSKQSDEAFVLPTGERLDGYGLDFTHGADYGVDVHLLVMYTDAPAEFKLPPLVCCADTSAKILCCIELESEEQRGASLLSQDQEKSFRAFIDRNLDVLIRHAKNEISSRDLFQSLEHVDRGTRFG